MEQDSGTGASGTCREEEIEVDDAQGREIMKLLREAKEKAQPNIDWKWEYASIIGSRLNEILGVDFENVMWAMAFREADENWKGICRQLADSRSGALAIEEDDWLFFYAGFLKGVVLKDKQERGISIHESEDAVIFDE